MEALSTQPRSASDSWSLLVAVWVAAAYAGFELLAWTPPTLSPQAA
jgi:hypothetical protein